MVAAPGAGAQTSPPTVTTLPGSTAIDVNFEFTGATISSPADPTPRSMTGYQAAVFVQSWLPDALYGHPELRDPPADLPVYRVDLTGAWGGDEPQVGYQTVYYASDGTTAYMSYPQDQVVTPTPSDPPPAPTTWFLPPTRAIEAFNGTATLIESGGTQAAAAATANGSRKAPTSNDSSSSSTPWVLYGVLVAGAVFVVVGAVLFIRRRSDHVAAAD
jgi:hypothetical protein